MTTSSTRTTTQTSAAVQFLERTNASIQVVIYSYSDDVESNLIRDIFAKIPEIQVMVYNLDQQPNGNNVHHALIEMTGHNYIPQVFVHNTSLGRCHDIYLAYLNGSLQEWLDQLTSAATTQTETAHIDTAPAATTSRNDSADATLKDPKQNDRILTRMGGFRLSSSTTDKDTTFEQ